MNKTFLWVLAMLLTLGSLFVFLIYLPSRRSDIEKKGALGYGTIQLKDSLPSGDGGVAFTATFVYDDAQKKNHMVVNQIDGGTYDSINAKQDIKVRYLPNDPDKAVMPGALALILQAPDGSSQKVISVVPPRAGLLRFLAWSALLGSIPVYYLAITSTAGPKKPKSKGPVIARR